MNSRYFLIWLPVAGATLIGITSNQAAPLDRAQILALHNNYRAEVGVPPLRWSERLAAGAEKWAKVIAGLDRMQHSGAADVGENVAFWSGNSPSLARMISTWGNEKSLFSRGVFPGVSRTGNWLSVSHYSQMIWRATTEVGCGRGNNGKTDFLVCWYSPKGNYVGQLPY